MQTYPTTPTSGETEASIAERVDAILAALEPPVTRRAVEAVAEKAKTAAASGPAEDRAEWTEIARELATRLARLDA